MKSLSLIFVLTLFSCVTSNENDFVRPEPKIAQFKKMFRDDPFKAISLYGDIPFKSEELKMDLQIASLYSSKSLFSVLSPYLDELMKSSPYKALEVLETFPLRKFEKLLNEIASDNSSYNEILKQKASDILGKMDQYLGNFPSHRLNELQEKWDYFTAVDLTYYKQDLKEYLRQPVDQVVLFRKIFESRNGFQLLFEFYKKYNSSNDEKFLHDIWIASLFSSDDLYPFIAKQLYSKDVNTIKFALIFIKGRQDQRYINDLLGLEIKDVNVLAIKNQILDVLKNGKHNSNKIESLKKKYNLYTLYPSIHVAPY